MSEREGGGGCRNSNSQLQIGRESLSQMCWMQSANTVVLLVVSVQSSDSFWPGEENVGPVQVRPVQVVCTALWPLRTFLYLAQLKRHFRNTRAHKSCLSLSRSLCICLCGAGDTLKARIWALFRLQRVWITPGKCRPQCQPQRWHLGPAKARGQTDLCFWQNDKMLLGKWSFPKEVIVMGGKKKKKEEKKHLWVWQWPGWVARAAAGIWCWSWLVLAKCWAQNSSEEGLSLCLTVKDTHSSLAICVPKVKHVLNEARVLRLGQSWIRNSSVFLQLLLENGDNIFLLPGRFWGQTY